MVLNTLQRIPMFFWTSVFKSFLWGVSGIGYIQHTQLSNIVYQSQWKWRNVLLWQIPGLTSLISSMLQLQNRPDKLIRLLSPWFSHFKTPSRLSPSFHFQSGISAQFGWVYEHFRGADKNYPLYILTFHNKGGQMKICLLWDMNIEMQIFL